MAFKMRSLFKRKVKGGNNANNVTKDLDGGGRDDAIPPMVASIDHDGCGESNSSANGNDDTRVAYSSSSSHSPHSMDDDGPPHPRPPQSAAIDPDGYYGVRNISRRKSANATNKSRDGVPVITSRDADVFNPSAVNSKTNYATGGFYSKSKTSYVGKERPRVRPSARTSAFGGAPRYDWMDIVSSI